MMEEHGADIIQMSVQGEEASSRLIGPDLDFVIVATGHEKRLGLMKVDATDRAVVLFESINQSAHTIVPELNGGRMQGNEDPWP